MEHEEKSRQLVADIVSLLHDTVGKDRDVSGWTREDFLHGLGSMRDALVYSILFVPTFVEVEGYIFLAELTPQPPGGWEALAANIRAARTKGGGDLAKLLESSNWVEISHLFADGRGTNGDDSLLALVVADAWRARLRGLYPKRNFEVRVLPASETGGANGVGFVELPAS